MFLLGIPPGNLKFAYAKEPKKMYNYNRRCVREECEWNTKQLGQTKSCPVHNGSMSTFQFEITLPWSVGDTEEVSAVVPIEMSNEMYEEISDAEFFLYVEKTKREMRDYLKTLVDPAMA